MKLHKLLIASALLTLSMTAWARNTVKKVTQVTDSIAITENWDYTITGATPFGDNGRVYLNNTEHGVIIINKLRPSETQKLLRGHVYINGKQATTTNCQVRMYGRGSIILPYSSSIKPLTCYTEANYEGKSYTNYTEGNDGGFMKTLTSTSLDNKIKSFKLKRGYMVTFATGKSGWGYSRCFIADQEDLEIPVMPEPLSGNVSSYRLFKWWNASKAGVHDTSKEANAALHTTSCFDWGQGNSSLLPDVEWVAHHIYEDWPSAATCGGVDGTCHMKTNNEPGNSSDDHPQDVETILNNWQNLMRTGMRLCSESSHDGSMNHLKEFITEIDKRGWRCDILDLHCYWDGQWNNLDWYISEYGKGRPCWISEWVWGSSWGNNGAFASNRRTDDATYNGTVPILERLNKTAKVERYFYWNSEQGYTKIWRDGKLTKLGEYYANMDVPLGYNAANEYVPTIVYQQATNLKTSYSTATQKLKISWSDDNGDMLDSLCVEVKAPGAADYQQVATVKATDKNAKTANSYSCTLDTTVISAEGIYNYRIVAYSNGSKKKVYTDGRYIHGEAKTVKCYLQNETGTFLQQGASWGTQATLGQTGNLFTTTLVVDKAIFNSGLGEGEKTYLGSNGYIDSDLFEWTLTPVREDENGTLYNISNGEKFIGANSNNNVVSLDLTDGSLPEAQWRLVTKEQRNEQMKNATAANPFEATYLLSNPNFDRWAPVTAWQGNGTVGGGDANQCMEKYNCTFDVYQTVSGLPAGNYLLTCQGFYRNGESTTSKKRNAKFYANEASIDLMSIADESGTKPNSMSTASTAFTSGKYVKNNNLEFTLQAGEKLRFGIKKDVAVDKDWTIFDNFRLYYMGDGKEDAIHTISSEHGQPLIYNLQGMPVNGSNLRPGIYVKGGKKIIKTY